MVEMKGAVDKIWMKMIGVFWEQVFSFLCFLVS